MLGSQKKLSTGRGAGVGVGALPAKLPRAHRTPPTLGVILPLRTEREIEGLCEDSRTT